MHRCLTTRPLSPCRTLSPKPTNIVVLSTCPKLRSHILMKKFFSAVRSHFASDKSLEERTRGLRNRQFRHLLVESLEGRRLMAANPVAQNDSGYFTPVNTDLVIGTSSVHLLANDIDIGSTSYSPSLVTSPSFGTLLSFGTNGSFTYRPNTGFRGIDTLPTNSMTELWIATLQLYP